LGGDDVISEYKDKDGHLTQAFQNEKKTLQVNCGKNLQTETGVVVA